MTVRRMVVASLVVACGSAASAMPNFARREGVSCNVCHTIIPRLNRVGYDFRNSGFRIPERLGQPNPREFEFGDMNAARFQSQAAWTRTFTPPRTVTPQGSLTFFEATLYPLTGSFGRWFASEGELSMSPEDFFEVENAYARATFGDPHMRVNVRLGVFHPFEGYGASDRPVLLARPLLQVTPAKDRAFGPPPSTVTATTPAGVGTTSTFFTPWNFDQVGLEAGYTFAGFNIAAAVLNGIFVNREENAAFPFQGGNLVRASSDPNFNSKDFQVFANQFFGDAALSAYYYHGRLTIPITGPVPQFTDDFDRAALYGTLPLGTLTPLRAMPVVSKLWVLAGYQFGWDTGFSAATGTELPNRVMSNGWFGELFAVVNDYVGLDGRYDWFDPSRGTSSDLIQTLTAGVNVALLNGAQAIAEYQYRTSENRVSATNPTAENSTLNQVRLRFIYIF